MKFRLLLIAACTAGSALIAAPAEAACCTPQAGETHHAASCAMPCCKHHATDIDIVSKMLTSDPQLNPAPPVRQTTEVWFMRPVLVGRSILQGRYVIEHDTDRMARGEPCTYIYAFDHREKPVVAFHCTHLDRDRADQNLVVLVNTGEGMKRLTEFQFAGEIASHGVPTVP
jgi:hypothetical protein